jgi:hypothetical protein
MTVRRRGEALVSSDAATVAEHVRHLFRASSVYELTVETKPQESFETVVRPNGWLLGTKMHVTPCRTELRRASTSRRLPQFYILGDALGFYDGYIRAFLTALRARVGAVPSSGDSLQAPTGVSIEMPWRRSPARVALWLLLFVALLVSNPRNRLG